MKPVNEKVTRKTSNIVIREGSARRRDDPLQRTENSLNSVMTKAKKADPKMLEQQKYLMQAENLDENEMKAVAEEANRMMSKKVKEMEKKVEGSLIELLEGYCNKLGVELYRYKADNMALKTENNELRKRIDQLSKKLYEHNRENMQLAKQNDTVDQKIEQTKDEMQRLKSNLRKKEYYLHQRMKLYDYLQQSSEKQTKSLSYTVSEQNTEISRLKQYLEEVIEYLEHYRGQGQNLKANLEERAKEFQKTRTELEGRFRHEIEKKTEKISRYQAENQQLEERLRQEEDAKKKYLEKYKDLEKYLSKKQDAIKELEGQLAVGKKRINDLSILKSSNKTILDEKIIKLTYDNEKLKAEVSRLKKKKGGDSEEEAVVPGKPQLFGSNDY